MRQQQQRREAADQARRADRAERSGAQTYRSTIDGEPADVAEHDSGRVEAYWGGEGRPDGDNHGHIITNDGTNAAYVRYPHETPVFDDPDDKRRRH